MSSDAERPLIPSEFPPDETLPPVSQKSWQRLAKVLYNHNPFYLLSVSCVLHGTAHWMRVEGAIAGRSAEVCANALAMSESDASWSVPAGWGASRAIRSADANRSASPPWT